MSNIYNINGRDIVDRIDTILHYRNETREELAKTIGRTKQVFTDWKAKDITPTSLDLFIMAKHLGTTYDYLLLGESDTVPDDIALTSSLLTKLTKEQREPIIELIINQVNYWYNFYNPNNSN